MEEKWELAVLGQQNIRYNVIIAQQEKGAHERLKCYECYNEYYIEHDKCD